MRDDDVIKMAELDRENPSSWAILHFKQQIESRCGFHFTAKLKTTNELCGFICGQYLSNDAEIHKITVARIHRHQGIGTALMHHTLRFLQKHSVQNCFLEFRTENQPARILYERCNFQPIAVRKKYYNSPIEDAIIMKLSSISS